MALRGDISQLLPPLRRRSRLLPTPLQRLRAFLEGAVLFALRFEKGLAAGCRGCRVIGRRMAFPSPGSTSGKRPTRRTVSGSALWSHVLRIRSTRESPCRRQLSDRRRRGPASPRPRVAGQAAMGARWPDALLHFAATGLVLQPVGRSVRSSARRSDRHTIRDYALRLAESDDLAIRRSEWSRHRRTAPGVADADGERQHLGPG